MAKKQSSAKGSQQPQRRLVAQNRKARHKYDILETLECGLVLVGSEVKSLRAGRCSLDEAYGRLKEDEVWLIGCDIPEYLEANRFNHNPKRPRKLLLHRREIRRFAARAMEKGLTLVPLEIYFKGPQAKVLMAIARGKKLYDKRQAMKKAEAERAIRRALHQRRL